MSARTRTTRRGQSRAGLVGLLVLAAIFFGVVALERSLRQGDDTTSTAPPIEAPGANGDGTQPAELAKPRDDAPAAANDASPAPTDGALAVLVKDDGGAPWSGSFELWIEHVPTPGSPSLRPGAFATFEGERAELSKLPLGRYTVFARAPGRRSDDHDVRFDATHAARTVELALLPAGVVSGRWVDEHAAPLDGLDVRLARAMPDGSRAHCDTTRTDADGRFRFDHVVDGTWQLSLGPLHDPIVGGTPVEHRGVETDVGDRKVAGLATLRVRVTDANGVPVAGARVHDGAMSGHFDLRTGEDGTCLARHLVARQYRVFAEDATHGSVNRPMNVAASEAAELELRFAP